MSGSAYLFDISTPNAPTEIAKLTPSDGAMDDYFGRSVGIKGNTVIIGANGNDDDGSGSGSAYLFDATTGAQLAKLTASDGAAGDDFGRSVGISDTKAIVGASMDNTDTEHSGFAYLFDLTNGAEIQKLTAYDSASDDWFGSSAAISNTAAVVGNLGDDGDGSFAFNNSGSAHLYDLTTDPGVPFCFGDGTGTACPCGNTEGAGEGCANDTGSGGLLTASGSNSVLADDLVFEASGLTSGPGLYFQGNNAVNGGLGNAFGDGLRCAGNQVIRLEVQFSSGGSSATSISVATKGGVSVGDTKRYQLWYRDTGGSPCNSGFNLTNGYEITWTS